MTSFVGKLFAHLRADRIGSTDAELVTAFVADRDGAAFAALVRRHGPMVLGACRRILAPDAHTAEDAFQATFLVLATRAHAVRPPGQVGAWLHGVAVRVARRAKTRLARQVTTDPANLAELPGGEPHSDQADLREVIDAVLLTLPEKYRAPVVLCDLEGRSRADAAAALGWTEGTLSGRLARARKLLADRLARRGYAPALLVPILTAEPLPPHLEAAGTVASDAQAGLAPQVIALAQGDATMSSIAFKIVAACALTFGGLALFSLFAADPPPPPPAPPAALVKPADAAPSWGAGPRFSNHGRVTALAIGTGVVAVGDDQGHVVLWDVKTGKKVETLKMGTDGGVQETIDGLSISRDGKQFCMILNRGGAIHQASIQPQGRDYLGFGDSGEWVHYGLTGDSKHWLTRKAAEHELLLRKNNPTAGRFEETLVSRFVHPDKITHAAGDADVVVSVAGLDQVTLRRWEAERDKPLWQVDLSDADIMGVQVSPGGKRVAVTGEAGLLRVFDAATGKPVSRAEGLKGTIAAAAFDRDGKWLVAGCRDGSARVVDVESGKVLATLKGHGDRILAVAFGPDGTIATGGADKLVKVWEPGN